MFPGATLYLGVLSIMMLTILTRAPRKETTLCLPLILLWVNLLSNLYSRMTKGTMTNIFRRWTPSGSTSPTRGS